MAQAFSKLPLSITKTKTSKVGENVSDYNRLKQLWKPKAPHTSPRIQLPRKGDMKPGKDVAVALQLSGPSETLEEVGQHD